MNAVIVSCGMVSPYGVGIDATWDGLVSNRSAIAPISRFATESMKSDKAALMDSVRVDSEDSLVLQILKSLFREVPCDTPSGTSLILATTTGEIDLLERSVLGGANDPEESKLSRLLPKVCELTNVNGPGCIVSAACASSTVAITHAAAMVVDGTSDSVIVVGCDSVSQFVYAGFSSLMALDTSPARPFDKHRSGLTPGEAAAYAVVTSRDRAQREHLPILAEIAGWGLSDDANHMTGPSRDGSGLAMAIQKALASARIDPTDVGSICAHGTGTQYNDGMEMKAFKLVFDDRPVPTYSVKGGIGHTMGAAGIVETLIAMRSLTTGIVPPTVGLTNVDEAATGWAAPHSTQTIGASTLTTNSGFGGINAALLLTTND